MLVSSTSMKAPSATTTPISHGLALGLHGAAGGAGGGPPADPPLRALEAARLSPSGIIERLPDGARDPAGGNYYQNRVKPGSSERDPTADWAGSSLTLFGHCEFPRCERRRRSRGRLSHLRFWTASGISRMIGPARTANAHDNYGGTGAGRCAQGGGQPRRGLCARR